MASFNGYPSWNAWNVSLWLNNTESDYRCIVDIYNDSLSSTKKETRANMLEALLDIYNGEKTPDGATINKRALLILCNEFIQDNYPNKI